LDICIVQFEKLGIQKKLQESKFERCKKGKGKIKGEGKSP
jgi:hypothetical protein